MGFKETGCYLNAKVTSDRFDCFPYVEHDDPVAIFGDGTVNYISRKHTPVNMQRDNINVKAIITIRHPIRRLVSHYRFGFKGFMHLGFETVNDMVMFGLQEGMCVVCVGYLPHTRY